MNTEERKAVYILAPNRRIGTSWACQAPFMGQLADEPELIIVTQPRTLAQAPRGMLYALAPGITKRPLWPEFLSELVIRNARHI